MKRRPSSQPRPCSCPPAHRSLRAAWLGLLLLAAACGRGPSAAAPAAEATAPSEAAKAESAAQAAGQAAASGDNAGSPGGDRAGESDAQKAGLGAAAAATWWPAHSLPAPRPTGPFDALVRIDAPQLSAREFDDALRPTAAALQSLPGVVGVATAAHAGQARIVVRFADDVAAAKGRTTLDAGLEGAKTATVGVVSSALVPRGARTQLAISWVGGSDAAATTAWAETTLLPSLAKLPGVALAEAVGATRPVLDLYLQPPGLSRFGVTIGELDEAVRAALGGDVAAGTPAGASIDKLLEGTKLTRHNQPNGAATPPTLADLVTPGRGEGDNTQRAWTGARSVLVARALGGPNGQAAALQTARVALERDIGNQKRPGDEHFVHSIHAMARYRVRALATRTPESPEALAKRLHQVLVDGQAHDVLLVEGIDGVPCELDAHCHDGRVFTLWIAAAGGRERPGALQILQGTLEPGGWQVHALHDNWDVALAWLIDDDATFAVISAGRDGGATSEVARAVTERLVRSASFASVRAGPKPATPRGPTAMVAQQVATTKGVAVRDLALAVALLAGPIPVGVVGGTTVRLALPSGVMAAEHGRLVLQARDAPVTLASLLQTATTVPEPVLLRLDGRPALYTAADSAGEASWVLAEHGHQDVERVVEPSSELSVLPLVLGQAPLSTRGGR